MTKLTDDLLLKALHGTTGWNKATTLKLAEDNPKAVSVLAQAA
jgi:hypothetical protein